MFAMSQILTIRQIDVDDKGSVDKATIIAALGQSGDADYDSVRLPIWVMSVILAHEKARETIKNVNVDSSGRLEVEDWVQLHSLLKAGKSQPVYVFPLDSFPLYKDTDTLPRLETNKGRIAVKGTAGSNSTHSINEDERRSFTDHINGVS
jgi:plastin-1